MMDKIDDYVLHHLPVKDVTNSIKLCLYISN